MNEIQWASYLFSVEFQNNYEIFNEKLNRLQLSVKNYVTNFTTKKGL